MISYTEKLPSPALQKDVECFWFASGAGNLPASAPERILPDGCLELIFHLGSQFQRWSAVVGWQDQPRSFVVGELTKFLLVRPSGHASIMGVRFRPRGAYRFLRFSLDEFTDQNIPLNDLWGLAGKHLEERVNETLDDDERQKLVEEFLLLELSKSISRPRFQAAVEDIIHSRGLTRVGEVAAKIGMSPRQLEREFRVGIGLSPKAFARIIRFQNLMRLVGEQPLREWTRLALDGGYADQPHMVREFREFTGQSPTEHNITLIGDLAARFISPRRLAALLGMALP
ncbi:MAG TPA: helix-turn-helix domain-containing protein [Pyrinomonadaceae bacterium]|nr:helix-turn-helix domain-containing protein [Pyrinomonadaceae bacterium]